MLGMLNKTTYLLLHIQYALEINLHVLVTHKNTICIFPMMPEIYFSVNGICKWIFFSLSSVSMFIVQKMNSVPFICSQYTHQSYLLKVAVLIDWTDPIHDKYWIFTPPWSAFNLYYSMWICIHGNNSILRYQS